MSFAQFLPVGLSYLILAAHFLRKANVGLFLVFLFAPILLSIKRRWIVRIMQILLAIGSMEWVSTTYLLTLNRIKFGKPWLRMVIIFSIIIIMALFAIWLLGRKKIIEKYSAKSELNIQPLSSFILTAVILLLVYIMVRKPVMLLFDRFFLSLGLFQIFLLAVYAAFITEKILQPGQSIKWRSRIWALFSIVFFGQFILGIIGADRFLMTGELHLPIPALIAAAPIYRGEKFFMSILFLSTIILVGPAWCSHLCYIGAWDHAFSKNRQKPRRLSPGRNHARIIIFILVIALAIILRLTNVSTLFAGIIAGGFGIVGVIIMATYSRRKGVMYHCITWCPIGLLTGILGKISPFRIKILNGCDECMKCKRFCRYSALDKVYIKARNPGITCTLCGDCIGSCPSNQLVFGFLKMDHDKARKLFYVMIISLHAAFLGLARL